MPGSAQNTRRVPGTSTSSTLWVQICLLTWSGGGDLNSRPLRPERVCNPATRCFAA
jgi:hypothetical protein